MKINLLLIIGIISSSLFDFTASESHESWIIMPPATVMQIINAFVCHHEVIKEGGIPYYESTHGIDVASVNDLLMFIFVVLIIVRELFVSPASKYFTFVFSAVFALSFVLMLSIGEWSLGVFGTWLFLFSVGGLLVWQYATRCMAGGSQNPNNL
jgi:hypothetical protein